MLLTRKESGQGLVEDALILVQVATAVIAAPLILGPIIGNAFATINSGARSMKALQVASS